MKICYFGTYDKKRPRNRVVIDGLKENGVTVIECHYAAWGEIEDKSQIRSWLSKVFVFFNFIWGHIVLLVRYLGTEEHDAVIVGYMGHIDMLSAKFLAAVRRKPLYFNVFLSLYDTMIFDRKLAKPQSLSAKVLYYLDKISCQLADKVLLDTQEHIRYFAETYRLKEEKFFRVFLGTSEQLFYPSPAKEPAKINPQSFIILFYGQFIPLHGTRYIIEAAKLLHADSDIAFTFIGAGQEYEAMKAAADKLGLHNITWSGWVPHEKIRSCIHGADICLGIFGDTDKARRVIPNKAFEIVAARKPLVTGDSPAARELFVDRENALLCRMADPAALADAIVLLKNDHALRHKIADNGFETFRRRCSTAIIGQEVRDMVAGNVGAKQKL